MKVKEIHGWGTDSDLAQFTGEERVTVEMIATYLDDGGCDCIGHHTRVSTYELLYREYGPWAMPPVVYVDGYGDEDYDGHIGGLHRMEAAFHAGLTSIPAFIIMKDEFEL